MKNFLGPILTAMLLVGFNSDAANVTLESEDLQIQIDSASGRLRKLVNTKLKQSLLDESSSALWLLELIGGDAPISASAGEVVVQELGKNRSAAKLIWRNFKNQKAPDLSVEVVIAIDSRTAQSKWDIVVRNLGELRLSKVHFPRLQNISIQEAEYLAVPVWMGQLTPNPRALLNSDGKPKQLSYDYPGHTSMQCLSWYSTNGAGLYFACDDTNSFRKIFSFSGDGTNNAAFTVVHLPENEKTPAKTYAPPYSTIVGTFKGDWFTAAEIYRSWATNQYWARESRLKKGTSPEWVPKTALWVWNRGRSEQVIGPALALNQELGLPVSAFWHWWHGCSYDTGFPEYLPPREGDSKFKSAIGEAHRRDVHAIVYMNQRLWGMTTESWTNQNAERFAVKGIDGKVHPEIYNTFTKAPCASMCMGTEFWRNTYADVAERAFKELHVDGIYMDQACSSLSCYDPSHGHAIGGGKYWMNGFRLLANDIRQRTAPKKGSHTEPIALAGEGVGESWLPYLDLMLSLQVSKERYSAPDSWEPIPFFQAVYHPYVIQYGNYSSLTMPPYDDLWPKEFAPKEPLKLLDQKFSRQFYLEQARAFVWGQQPTIANFLPQHLKQRPEEIAFVLQLARLRQRALKYLLHGTFLRIPELNAPEEVIDISRLSIYAGQQGGLKTFEKRVAIAVGGAWLAADGDVALTVANISDHKVPVELDLSTYPVPPKGKIFLTIDNSHREELGSLGDRKLSKFDLQIPPRAAALVELSAAEKK